MTEKTSVLETVNQPEDVKRLSDAELLGLSEELRVKIEETVRERGGHLSANLGVVELTIALHRVYDAPQDKIIFDVGHQCYAHKMMTGRREAFFSLRSEGGISGFPSREESEYDAFGAGHASTGVSAALGFARARDALKQSHSVVAVLGDGAMTGGEAYEALDDAGHSGTPLVVVLNDNGMSISPNVGGVSRYLNRLRASRGYWGIKNRLTSWLNSMPRIGGRIYRGLQAFKNGIKYLFIKGQFFDALGFVYLGPVDGHDIPELERTIRQAKGLGKPVLVHVVTRKGKGFAYVEESPDLYHGVSKAVAEPADGISGKEAAEELTRLARGDGRICVITAAMPQGTGMARFAQDHPERFYDVGIAEEHAATLCTAMAAGGMRPFFAVYSTFFQRCYDQALHDAALQNIPAVFLLDRAGLVGEDGATHQGVYDLPLLLTMPNMTVLAPRSILSLRAMLRWAVGAQGPVAVRYPRCLPFGDDSSFQPGRWQVLREGEGVVALAVGPAARAAMRAAQRNAAMRVVSVESVFPMDLELLYSLREKNVLTIEEGVVQGGFGSLIARTLAEEGIAPKALRMMGTPVEPLPHAALAQQLARYGLDAEGILRAVEALEGDG